MRSEKFYVIELELAFAAPVSIGDPLNYDMQAAFEAHSAGDDNGDDGPPDTPVVRDPRDGSPTIQGTSLMGALRHHLSTYDLEPNRFRAITLADTGARTGKQAHRKVQCNLAHLVCGSLPEERATAPKGGAAAKPALRPSALRLVQVNTNSTAVGGGPHPPAIDNVTRVAISRRSGAAVDNKLFTQERAHITGATALLTLDLNVLRDAWSVLGRDGGALSAGQVLSAVVAALQTWPVHLGGHASTGQGVAEIRRIRTREVDLYRDLPKLMNSKTTAEFLRNGLAPWQGGAAPDWVVVPERAGQEVLTTMFRLVDPLFIDPRDCPEEGRSNKSETSTFISGSAWKGIVRSRCEYILRSVGVPACLSSDDGTCGECPTCRLFGWTPRQGLAERGLDSPDGASALLRFADSRICGGAPGSDDRALQWLDVDHVAINRFTGGAEDSKLFVERAIAPPGWLRLTVRTKTSLDATPTWAAPLLWMALRDIHDGLVGVGHSTTRGMGTLALAEGEVPKMMVALQEWPDALTSLRKGVDEVGAA